MSWFLAPLDETAQILELDAQVEALGNTASIVADLTSNVASLASAVANFSFAGADPGFDVVLLLGQSNMVAYDESDTLDTYLGYAVSTSERIFQLGQRTYTLNGQPMDRTNRVVPVTEPLDHPLPFDLDRGGKKCASIGMSFARLYESQKLAPSRRLLLVPCAWQGTGFTGGGGDTSTTAGGQSVVLSWDASYALDENNTTPNLLRLARNRLRIAMAYDPVANPTPSATDAPAAGNAFKGILWHQGEFNITVGTSEASYKAVLGALVNYLRDAVPGSGAVPFVAGLPHDRFLDTFDFRDAPTADCLRKVGDATFFGVSACGFADSAGLTAYNDFHFDNAGYNAYGRRYFTTYVDVAAGVVTATAYNLQATMGTTTATFAWVPSNTTSATMEVSTDGGVTYTSATASVGVSSAAVSNLTASTTYTFRVTPSRNGTAGTPATITATTLDDPNAPSISGLAATAQSTTAISVSWTASNVVTSVRVELSTDGGATYGSPQVFTSSPAAVTGLTPDTTYTVRATPYAGGIVGTSRTTSVVTTLGIVLSSFAAPVRTASGLQVTWSAQNVTSITLEVSATGGSSYGSPQPYETSPIAVTDLTANTSYTLRATPYSGATAGTPSTISASTLAAASGSGIGTVPSGLILHVTFGTSSVPTVDERITALTAVNAPAATSVAPRGYVLDDLSGGYLRTALNLPLSYTKSVWVYCTNVDNFPNTISSDTPFATPASRDYMFVFNNVMSAGHSPNDNTQAFCTDTIAMQLNQWVHYVFTWDNSTNTGVLYRDGTAVRTVTDAAYARTGTSGPICVGNFAQQFPWTGYLDNARVYNRAITSQEVSSIYAAETMS